MLFEAEKQIGRCGVSAIELHAAALDTTMASNRIEAETPDSEKGALDLIVAVRHSKH